MLVEMLAGSLFSGGVDGISIAAEAVGFCTGFQCEWDPEPLADWRKLPKNQGKRPPGHLYWGQYNQMVLQERFRRSHLFGDVRHINRRRIIKSLYKRGLLTRDPAYGPLLDLLSGGFPCQPASLAGDRKGTADDRWLWPAFAACIREIRPRWVLAENVPGLLSVDAGGGFGEVLRDLAALGYDAGWCVYGAGDVGAPHQRDRVFIVARLADAAGARPNPREREPRGPVRDEGRGSEPERRDSVVADADCAERWPEGAGASGDALGQIGGGVHAGRQEGSGGPEQRGSHVANTPGQSQREPDHPADAIPGGGPARSLSGGGSAAGPTRPAGPTQPGLGGTADGPAAWLHGNHWPAPPGPEQYPWEPPRTIERGIPHRRERLKAVGNAVMPQQAIPLVAAIADQIRAEQEATA